MPPAFASPGLQLRLFVDQVMVALQIQLLQAQADAQRPSAKGVLPPWQLQRARDMLVAGVQGGISVAEVAAHCGLSRGYFCQAFKRSTGCTPHRWLQDVRVTQAKALLLGTMPIIEIASRCGFADQSHLTRVFGRVVGMPPARWRALNK
ncbi:AraC family transcriptional regulator [Pseudoxanthomonas sp.]|uniref:helix-turn-helix domain-containing protein n=1 Tax=Pseudoxanthomonas sp. TaxID=1871049 RepID=UPI002634C70D|nr:AraC family transcriptional regulator [Pseudoxanthomonas sp.]WDS36503.1 MAG: AraC family transcriptional regulator [Pseudoxanthomonas sp.]